jgi:gas vesicle protein
MSKVIAWVKNIRPIKILTVLCMGVLLIVTQACGSVTAGEPKAGANSELSVPKGDKVLNSYEGGMNNFSDTDPRSKEAKSEVKAKTEALTENAEQHLINKTSPTGENSLGKNLQQSAEGTKEKVGNSSDNFAKGVQRGIENIKDNTKNAVDDLTKGATSAADDAKTNVQRTAQDATSAVNRTVKEAD